MMTKTQVVLHMADAQRNLEGRHFHTKENPLHLLTMDEGVWQEMARPDFITVTIEPGDRLNDDDDGG